MSRDIDAMFFIPKAVKKAIEKHGQELVEGAIVQELQFHLDDLTPRKLNKIIKEAKARKEIRLSYGLSIKIRKCPESEVE